MTQKITPIYSAKDFKSDQEVRWCPGCGDYAILTSVQKALADLPYPREDYAIISGIGCSSRFPYYMNTYGFHSIHGRAAAIATGVKLANPKLKVLQISGDGDALAIGGNHFIHTVRRNVDISMLIFNNEVYGLTKGQFSPTSSKGTVTKTSPNGTLEEAFDIAELALGAKGQFFARSLDSNIKLTTSIVKTAIEYEGTSVIEILQNCVVFNNQTHSAFFDKEQKLNNYIILEDGQPMLYGRDKSRGLVLDNKGKLRIAILEEEGLTADDVLVHDAQDPDPYLHGQLAAMKYPEFPIALGVIRAAKAPTYNRELDKQLDSIQKSRSIQSTDDLLNSGETWKVE